jgi:hypothetical protein
LCNARAFANFSPATRRLNALGVVRGDEPDRSGKRNLFTALTGLQRAADRHGNRGTHFRALVLEDAACGGSAIAASRASSIPPPQAMSRSKSRRSYITERNPASARMRRTPCSLAKQEGDLGSSGPGRGSGGTCSNVARRARDFHRTCANRQRRGVRLASAPCAAEISTFYRNRRASGPRTSRHFYSGLRIDFETQDRAHSTSVWMSFATVPIPSPARPPGRPRRSSIRSLVGNSSRRMTDLHPSSRGTRLATSYHRRPAPGSDTTLAATSRFQTKRTIIAPTVAPINPAP